MNGKKNLSIRLAVCLLMLALVLAVPAAADTHYVSAGQSIQAAIDDANDGDEIEVTPGTYNEAIDFKGKAVRLYSSDGREVTTIDANGLNSSVVKCESGEDANTVLEGFTITGGNANGPDPNDKHGGGMLNISSNPTVTGCTFISNSASRGGGMYNYLSSPTVTNCIFTINSAELGGGGMYNRESSLTLINCTFTHNSTAYGGGMFNIGTSSPTVTNCTFSGNTATNGGGMYSNGTSPTVTNCTFSGNWAKWDGGGMLNNSSYPLVTNCIVWNNTWGQITYTNTTSPIPMVTYSDVQYANGESWFGDGCIEADPLFVNAASGDLRLLSDASPCVDAGDNSALPADTTDLDNDGNTVEAIPIDLYGNPRVFDGDENGSAIVDMGSYEYREPLPELVAHWKLDEYDGYTAYDSAGENHGTLYGGPDWQPAGGQAGGALQLDGVDDYVDCGNDDSLNIVDEITLAVWVKTNDAGNSENNPYVIKGDYSYALKHYVFNYIEFFIYDNDWWQTVRYPVDSSFNGVWHHLAGTYNGSELKLYIDGGLEATTPYAGSINISTYNVNIGRNPEIPGRLYGGMIDDVRIYNYTLTSDEILYISCTEPIKSDLDGNCKVDFRDFALLLSEWLTCNLPRQELCWEQ